MYTVTYNVAPGTDITVHDIAQIKTDTPGWTTKEGMAHLIAANGLNVYDVRKDKIVKVVKQDDDVIGTAD